LEGNRPTLPRNWPESLCDLLKSCWDNIPDNRPDFRHIISKWKDLEIDVLCPDLIGRELCHTLWGQERYKTYPFLDFIKLFVQNCMTTDIFRKKPEWLRFINLLLCKSSYDDEVTLERICSVIAWFGPLDKETNCSKFFNRIIEAFSHNYFHGFVSETKIYNSLRQMWEINPSKSYFVFRLTFSDIGEFTLTFIDKKGDIFHKKNFEYSREI